MDGVALIAAERQRQIEQKRYTLEHDQAHGADELAWAAVSYAAPADRRASADGTPVAWPWEAGSWKPTPDDRKRELVKAGALIAAAIDAVPTDE